MSEEERREPTVDWSPAEAAALAGLRAAGPPADLEDDVVRTMAKAGLIGGGGVAESLEGPEAPRVPAHRAWAWAGLALAACLAAFVAGISVAERGRGRGEAPTAPVEVAISQPRWLLVLYEDAAYRAPATPEERAARVQEYTTWATDLEERGIVLAGEELAGPVESEMLDGRRGGIEIGPGAPSGPVGTLAGYFLIRAPDQAAAVAVARSIPHLAHGGTVVVRRVVEH